MSTNTDHLTHLPNDAFDAIASDFDLADLCSLRLTSHNLHAIATTPNFQARFHHIRTNLSKDRLESLTALWSNPDLSHLIEEITVLATHYDDRELREQVKDGFESGECSFKAISGLPWSSHSSTRLKRLTRTRR